MVLGSSGQQSVPGVLVVGEGHAEHHVGVVLKHRQWSELLPPKYPHPMVPARRRQEFTVGPDTKLGDPGVDQGDVVLELKNHTEEKDLSVYQIRTRFFNSFLPVKPKNK